jgi:holo-[acyl-carrier protein] synthase
MIYGIGTDVVEVLRIEQALNRHGEAFAKRILTETEFTEFQQSHTQARFLAKRFAAKEAFAKALGTGVRAPATMQNIGISHDKLGKPVFVLAPVLQTLIEEKNINQQHVSISDEKALAVAFVVLES